MRHKRLILLGALGALALAGSVGASSAPATPAERLRPGLAIGLAPSEVPPEVPPPPAAEPEAPAEPYFPFLRGEDQSASISIGDTSNGLLVNGVPIVESDALGILPEQKERDLAYGSGELVEMIEHAAERLHEATDTKLWLGNVARRGGGDIEWSVSHNSGRDADIAFCYSDHEGRPVDPPGLVPLNGQGIAKHHNLRFDAARTWIVVKALLSYPQAEVQYLFISDSLKKQLIAHAAALGESPQLLERAAAVVRQPGASAPHHDHLHLRIYCTERDVVGGCLDSGVMHPWAEGYAVERRRAVERFAAGLGAREAEQRKRVVERLTLLDAREHAEAVAARLADEAPSVRAAAARALASLGSSRQAALLEDRFAAEDDLEVRLAILEAVGSLGGESSGRFLAQAVGRPRLDHAALLPALEAAETIRGPALFALLPDAARAAGAVSGAGWPLAAWSGPRLEQLVLQLAAIEAAARGGRLEPVEPLVELLRDRSPAVRTQAARALRHITNLTYWVDWTKASEATRSMGLQRWRAAFARGRKAPRRAWLTMGFRAAGYRVPELRQKHAWELVRAVAGADHLSYNAQRLLMQLFDHHPPSLRWSKPEACEHWLRWIRARRHGYKLEKPPAKTSRACYGS